VQPSPTADRQRQWSMVIFGCDGCGRKAFRRFGS
jgi:hypothetical protein